MRAEGDCAYHRDVDEPNTSLRTVLYGNGRMATERAVVGKSFGAIRLSSRVSAGAIEVSRRDTVAPIRNRGEAVILTATPALPRRRNNFATSSCTSRLVTMTNASEFETSAAPRVTYDTS
jgi:hypothetical protein